MKTLSIVANAVGLALTLAHVGRADITTGLAHYWPFDETSGYVAADSVGDNDVTLFNWGQGEARWVPGRVGNAIDFGADYRIANDNYALTDDPITFNQYTISFFLWTRDDNHNIGPRLATPLDGYNGWVLINQFFGRGVGFWNDRGVTSAQDPNPPKVDVWEHYAVTLDIDTGMSTIYRDGSPAARAMVPSGVSRRPLRPWVFGHHDDLTNHDRGSFSGLMDEIRIYNRILDPNEVLTLALVTKTGDFNHDNRLDATDIDLLTRQVRSGAFGVEFDLNGDTTVDELDRVLWIKERKSTFFGDTNLDGVFNTSDLVSVFIDGEYEDAKASNSVWATGDWNGDGEFSTADFVYAFQDGGYERTNATIPVSVPEPCGAITGWLIAGSLFWRRRIGHR